MRVFCRFAPLKEARHQSSDRRLHVSLSEPPSMSTATSFQSQRLLTVADAVTGASASVLCSGVYFPSNAKAQEDIFEDIVKPLIAKAKLGGKGSVLCYGQTSTGKTHTIFGPDGGNTSLFVDECQRGIVPRLAEALFLDTEEDLRVANVDVRLCEVYNEVVTDLVAQLHYDIDGVPRKTQYKSVEKGKILRSLHKMTCSNPSELNELLLTLSEMRLLYSTENNTRSSRSHVVMQLTLGLEGGRQGGQLTIADLAGSESLKGTQSLDNGGSTGISLASCSDIFASSSAKMRLRSQAIQRRQETKNINTSLFALKRVISSLHAKSKHVSYLESMLTTVLESCLDADAALVACCSSSGRDLAETLATLRFAKEASGIQVPESILTRQRVEALREAMREDAAAQAVQDGVLEGRSRPAVPYSVASVPSSVDEESVSASEDESVSATSRHVPNNEKDLLIDNLKTLATDQREHIAALEGEIERLYLLLSAAQLQRSATENTNSELDEEDHGERLASKQASKEIERLERENSQLRAQLAAQSRSYNKRMEKAAFEIRCLQNELALIDASDRDGSSCAPCIERPTTPPLSPVSVIEMEETPVPHESRKRSEENNEDLRRACEDKTAANRRTVTAALTSEVIKDVSEYIASVRAQLSSEVPGADSTRGDGGDENGVPKRERKRVVKVFSPDSRSWDSK